MQDKPKSNKNIFVVMGILIAIGVASYMYITRDQSPDDLLLSVSTGPSASLVDGDLLTALLELKKLNLNASAVFNNPVWKTLVDFGQTLTPEEPFRANPFAPIGDGAQTQALATTTR